MVNSVSFFHSSTENPPFWIPIHIVIPERPTESAVFNVTAGTLISQLFHFYCVGLFCLILFFTWK
jgi:hypothetical protein